MYLKNINWKRLLVLNVYIRSAREDFQSLKTLEELNIWPNIFSYNLDLRENVSFSSVRKLFVHKYVNCLTARKLKARK